MGNSDLTPKSFTEIYAQTLAYGMFAASVHDPAISDFSRQEAVELIPKSNPFYESSFLDTLPDQILMIE